MLVVVATLVDHRVQGLCFDVDEVDLGLHLLIKLPDDSAGGRGRGCSAAAAMTVGGSLTCCLLL